MARLLLPVWLCALCCACSPVSAPSDSEPVNVQAGGPCGQFIGVCASGLVCTHGLCVVPVPIKFSNDAGKSDAAAKDSGPGDVAKTDVPTVDAPAADAPDVAAAPDVAKADVGADVDSTPDVAASDVGEAEDALDTFSAPDVVVCQPKCNGTSCDDGCGGSFCSGKYCDDSNACTQAEMCVAGNCSGGSPVDCEDGNACTSDSCNPGSGCVNSNSGASCDDGNLCTTGDTCQNSACQAGVATVCSTSVVCTTASCSPFTGQCQTKNAKNGSGCDDGKACTSGDACNNGNCAGSALNCDDGNACTLDSCVEASGCSHVADPSQCDPNAVATGNWRIAVTQGGATFTTTLALVQAAGSTGLSGNAIDLYGLSTASGTFTAGSGTIAFSKSYFAGTSAKSAYNYTGKLSGNSMSGSWASSDGKVTGTFTAARQSAILGSVAGGAWTLTASWGNATFTLSVTAEGYLTGTMSDDADSGSSNLVGVIDLGNGSTFFRKLYGSGTTWWYLGTMNGSGTAMSGGTWGPDGVTLTSGTWSAGR